MTGVSSDVPRKSEPPFALSVDVEDYFQVQAFVRYVARESWSGWPSRVERNTRRLLDLFDETGARATFFTLGWIARKHPALVRDIAAREVHRQYLALAHGVPGQARFSVEAPIGRDPASRVRMAVLASGKPARTDVECLAAAQGVSALRCTLHTGRTHQIRVHLASRGHPLLADTLYGGRPLLGLTRQALHAARLAFKHPATRASLQFEAPLPQDLAAAWAQVTEA